MKIIGFNLEKTSYGLPLDNGGACLVIDGKVKMAIAEERLDRKQYSSGFKLSIKYLLENNNLNLNDIDLFVASSCLEVIPKSSDVQKQLKENGFDIPLKKIKVCDHHLSHAYSAYYPSGFDNAIIMIIDGDGNVLTKSMKKETDNIKNYYKNKIEHSSFYIGKKDNIELLEREEILEGENGFGGVYRYFTYFCGFYGYKFAGKLMGLSAYGHKRNKYKNIKIFDLLPNGKVKCLVPDSDRNREHSPKIVEDWLNEQGVKINSRKPHEEIKKDIEDIAFLMQRELDNALIHKVKYLIKKTGIKNLCIAGGVGLNAVSNRAILDNTDIKKIFIQPASGDSGQCLGNAFFGVANYDKENIIRKPISVYLGKEYSNEVILKELDYKKDRLNYEEQDFEKLVRTASKELSQGKIIGWFQGKSEFGPRALGNRSILANPTLRDMKEILNKKVKHREAFRPFAPSVIEEEKEKWFDIKIDAPYMILNAGVKQPDKIPAVTHIDNSARIQTVNKHDNPKFHKLLKAFQEISKVPILLNTSFNDNEAIVESPKDAINTFLNTELDYLFIGNYFVRKK